MISKFVDTYLRLDGVEEQAFQTEIDRMGLAQKEAIMQVTTSWEEKGIEKGREETRQVIARNMLKDNLPLEQISRLTGLTIAQLQQLQAEN